MLSTSDRSFIVYVLLPVIGRDIIAVAGTAPERHWTSATRSGGRGSKMCTICRRYCPNVPARVTFAAGSTRNATTRDRDTARIVTSPGEGSRPLREVKNGTSSIMTSP